MTGTLRAGGLAAAIALLLAAGADAAPSRFMINRVNVLQPMTALGAEPFWDVTVTGRSVVWSDPEHERLTGSVGRPKLKGGKAVWRGTVDGRPITITLLREDECSDGMSDFIYPVGARVTFDGNDYRGCAAAVAAFERRDREGRDEGEIR